MSILSEEPVLQQRAVVYNENIETPYREVVTCAEDEVQKGRLDCMYIRDYYDNGLNRNRADEYRLRSFENGEQVFETKYRFRSFSRITKRSVRQIFRDEIEHAENRRQNFVEEYESSTSRDVDHFVYDQGSKGDRIEIGVLYLAELPKDHPSYAPGEQLLLNQSNLFCANDNCDLLVLSCHSFISRVRGPTVVILQDGLEKTLGKAMVQDALRKVLNEDIAED